MATTADYLARYGVTLQQAHDFVFANLSNLQLVFNVAHQFGVTNQMLGDIAGGFSGEQVRAYFSAHGIDSAGLDPAPAAPNVPDQPEPGPYYSAVGVVGVPGD